MPWWNGFDGGERLAIFQRSAPWSGPTIEQAVPAGETQGRDVTPPHPDAVVLPPDRVRATIPVRSVRKA
jgi:hypothetical protein